MNQIIIEWHDQFALLSEETDAEFYICLRKLFPLEHKSKEEVEALIYKTLSNLPNNHYGKFEEQTQIIHKIKY